ncbi:MULTISPECIES: sulfotransferase family 2 domain-containing protein [unclassified Roseobacter]|uniref:sulfotransferase family 2 domain-containing protein n=1 Tax=unclassified Roseobacter TaxID=196798 RepID=UPI001490A4F4|nr:MULTISPECIES: sulfotransferase family 2 domain-containing protein [unclassified Roseobacter]NNV47252.1 sulfotransferase family 2 domain-containing protein [Roseobacter sp. HKCCD6265]NNV68783.1 sulfotransferase family 2 domain-containing protein [Roseobacter sp. HKCCD8474]NNV85847.1 sulfotransferase family 2 domain-containing protein [Roseobacter sp. HKCCD8414]NNV94566.1 sulfotransferase family 2 domain-containing protein [Roseobacter sp. HKCCD8914]NNW19886.1 sulfotransferase family 2 domain
MLLYFCHIPKTGGRNIERWMNDAFGNIGFIDADWTDRWKRGGWISDRLGTSRQHMDWATACGQLDRTPDQVFAVVRDPVTRLQSEYRFQSRHRRKRRALARIGFTRWCRVMFVASRIYPSVFDNHFRCQSDFVPPEAKVFYFEDGLDAVTVWLASLAPKDLPAVVLQGPETYAHVGDFDTSEEDLALIRSWFARDYESFGYKREPGSGVARIPLRDRMLGLIVALAFRMGRI